MRVLIAGCGYLGARIAQALAAEGHAVFALRRSATPAPTGCTAVQADLCDRATLRELPEVDALVFSPTPDRRDEACYRRTYVEGAQNLAEALLARGMQPRWLHHSSTAIYEEASGAWVDEALLPEPRGFRARLLLESEQRAARSGIEDVVALRLAGLYGPGRTGMIRRLRAGEARVRGAFTNRIHRDDAAAASVHLLTLEQPAPLYLGVDRKPALDTEVYGWLAGRLGVPAAVRAAQGQDAGRGKRCRSDRLIAAGYGFRFPGYREGYGSLLESEPEAR